MKFLSRILILMLLTLGASHANIINQKTVRNNISKFAKNNGTLTINVAYKNFPKIQNAEKVKAVIEAGANAWSKFANIDFNFLGSDSRGRSVDIFLEVYSGMSERKSRFGTSPHGAWYASEKTVKLNIPQDGTPSSWFQVSAHEFGHVLGFAHEHQHEERQFTFDIERLLKKCIEGEYFTKRECRATTEYNNERVFKGKLYKVTEYDSLSIMHYLVQPPVIIENVLIGGSEELSLGDKLAALNAYPGRLTESEARLDHAENQASKVQMNSVGACSLHNEIVSVGGELLYSYQYSDGSEAFFLSKTKEQTIKNASFDQNCLPQ